MAEIGIDISGQRAKHLNEFRRQQFAWLITVCDRAWQDCAAVPGVENPAHWGIEDPAAAEGPFEEQLEVYRRVQSDIRNRLHMFILAAGRPDVRRWVPVCFCWPWSARASPQTGSPTTQRRRF